MIFSSECKWLKANGDYMYAYILTKSIPKKLDDLMRAILSLGMNPTRLYGEIDIIVEADANNELELYEKKVKPLTLVNGTTCNTYVAVKTYENKEITDPLFAYIFIEVKPNELLDTVYSSLTNVIYLKRASIVYGGLDIIASISVRDINQYKSVLQVIQNIDGINKTSTLFNTKNWN